MRVALTHHKLQDDTVTLNSTELNKQKSDITEDDVLETTTISVVTSVATNTTHTTHQVKESQEEEDEESEEENTDIVQSLIASFLGGLSTVRRH